MSNPLISVILPYYNAVHTLEAAAISILQQSFSQFELLLISNASTDHSPSIAAKLTKQDSRISCLEEPNKGVSHAFNFALSKAKGQFIARMDADDVSHPDRLLKQIDFLNKNKEVDIVATQVEIPNIFQNQGFQEFVDWSNKLLKSEEIYLARFIEQPVVNPSILCRKYVFTQCGSYKHGNFPEDYDWFLRVMEKGIRIAKIPKKLLVWNDSTTRLSRTDERYSVEAFYRKKAFYLANWLKNKKVNLPIAIWGMGKKSKKRAQLLENNGITISLFIDMFPTTKKEINYLYYKDLPVQGKYFIISYVGNRGARDEIKSFLLKRGYKEGIDFLLAA